MGWCEVHWWLKKNESTQRSVGPSSESKRGPFSIYEQPKYKPNLTLTLTLILTLTIIQTLILILTQILTLKPTWVDATIRSHFGCSYIEKEPKTKLGETLDTRNVSLYPYWQYTNLFIFRFVSEHCTLRLLSYVTCAFLAYLWCVFIFSWYKVVGGL